MKTWKKCFSSFVCIAAIICNLLVMPAAAAEEPVFAFKQSVITFDDTTLDLNDYLINTTGYTDIEGHRDITWTITRMGGDANWAASLTLDEAANKNTGTLKRNSTQFGYLKVEASVAAYKTECVVYVRPQWKDTEYFRLNNEYAIGNSGEKINISEYKLNPLKLSDIGDNPVVKFTSSDTSKVTVGETSGMIQILSTAEADTVYITAKLYKANGTPLDGSDLCVVYISDNGEISTVKNFKDNNADNENNYSLARDWQPLQYRIPSASPSPSRPHMMMQQWDSSGKNWSRQWGRGRISATTIESIWNSASAYQ